MQLVVPYCQEHFILKKHHINDIDWIFPNIEKCTLNKSKSDTSRKIWKPLLIYKPGNEASRKVKNGNVHFNPVLRLFYVESMNILKSISFPNEQIFPQLS